MLRFRVSRALLYLVSSYSLSAPEHVFVISSTSSLFHGDIIPLDVRKDLEWHTVGVPLPNCGPSGAATRPICGALNAPYISGKPVNVVVRLARISFSTLFHEENTNGRYYYLRYWDSSLDSFRCMLYDYFAPEELLQVAQGSRPSVVYHAAVLQPQQDRYAQRLSSR